MVQHIADTALVAAAVLLVEMRRATVVVLGERLVTAQWFEVVVVGPAWLVEVMRALSGWLVVDGQTVVALLVEMLVVFKVDYSCRQMRIISEASVTFVT